MNSRTPRDMIDIYKLILIKKFIPVFDSDTLILWDPKQKYSTIYRLKNNKLKWHGGVMPHRILK